MCSDSIVFQDACLLSNFVELKPVNSIAKLARRFGTSMVSFHLDSASGRASDTFFFLCYRDLRQFTSHSRGTLRRSITPWVDVRQQRLI